MSTTPIDPPVEPASPSVHRERSISSVTGETILIACDCPIGEDHTYADWLARFTTVGAR